MALIDRFERELLPLLQGQGRTHGGFHRCDSVGDAAEGIARLCDEKGLRRILVTPREELLALHRELTDRLGPERAVLNGNGRTAREYESFDAGVGGADVLVAESASVGLLTPGEESALLSLLPSTHLVVAPASRLVERIHDAMRILQDEGGRRSRSLTLITGPSRTADIEKILVMPAHGPESLHVYLVEDR